MGAVPTLRIESFVLGNDPSSSIISAAEQGLKDTTYTTNVKNWKIEDYVSNHMEFHSILNDQQELGTYSGVFEKQKVDKFLDGLKHSHFIVLRSMILCNPKMRDDFNATAAHVKDMVNRTPTLKNTPGRQVSAMGRGVFLSVVVRLTMYFKCAAVALKSFRIFGLHRIMDLKPIKWLCFNPSRNLLTFFFEHIAVCYQRLLVV